MRGRTCIQCIHHRVIHLGVEVDEDGDERPIMEHYCMTASGERRQCDAELEFGCGLFKEKVMI